MEMEKNEPEDELKLTCGICGNSHKCTECTLIKFNQHVKDTPMPSKARLSIPSNLQIEKMTDETFTVIAREAVPKGTRFGPFEAKKIFTLEPTVVFPLRLFQGDSFFKEYYLDTSNEFECNWMYFVQPACNYEEQNLICYEDENSVFFISIREIRQGEHLRVWYGEYYARKMCKEVLRPENKENEFENKNLDVNELVKDQQKIPDRKIWICKFCGKQDNKVIDFANHIMEHYNLQLKKVCEICKEAFQTRQNLKKHVRMNHYKETTLGDKIELDSKKCGEAKTEAVCKADVLGGPLLNEVASDNFENTNALLEHMMLPGFDMEQSNAMLDNENLNLGVESLLNENFELNIEETNDKFVCDICLKSFNKLRFLIKHIVRHTGKFTCVECSKVFARKENFSSHSCQSQVSIQCPQCDSVFSNRKYLSRHILTTHNLQFRCTAECRRVFTSQKTLDEHKCVTVYTCTVCDKTYNNMRSLNRHKKVHNAKEPTQPATMCEICSKQFSNNKVLMQHLKSHEKRHECEICCKKFARFDNYRDHMNLHSNSKPHKCPKCSNEFTSKKTLKSHMEIHENKFNHSCSMCSMKFRQKSNLTKHFDRNHRRVCLRCKQEFDDADKLKEHMLSHYEKYYKCPVCKVVMKLRSSLTRHVKKKHSQSGIDFTSLKSMTCENIDNNNLNTSEENENCQNSEDNSRNENNNNDNEEDSHAGNDTNCEDIVDLLDLKENTMQDIDSNLDYIVNNYDPNFSEAEKNKSLVDTDTVLDFNSLEMDFEQNFNIDQNINIANQEVCLSMPELTQMEQNITLGENAYILENGTIVEPREQGQVVLYILDQKEQKL